MNELRRIIINADDFGLSSAVNEAVLHASETGILSSATLMVNMPGFIEAAKATSIHHRLGVGVHLNLLRGKPVSDPSTIHTILDDRGFFLGNISALWKRFLISAIDPEHIERELAAQVALVMEHGIRPTHLDSEKHLHLFLPQLWEPVCRIAASFNIPCVRVVREPISFFGLPRRPMLKQLFKTAAINWRSQGFARLARRQGLRFVDTFFGIAMSGQMTTGVYRSLFNRIQGSSCEVMCHPAETPDAASLANQTSWLDPRRVDEYRALVDPSTKEALIESKIKLINYGEL